MKLYKLLFTGISFGYISAFSFLSPVTLTSCKTSNLHNAPTMVLTEPPQSTTELPRSPTAAPLGTQKMTMTRFLCEKANENPAKYREFESLMISIQIACKQIAKLVATACIRDLTGFHGGINIQGEDQKKLDVISNDILKSALRYTGKMGVIASEEEDTPILVEESLNGKYVATFDPLDGSSNIDAGISTGTIFGIFEEAPDAQCILEDTTDDLSTAEQLCLLQTLQPGSNLVAAGYCMYSSSTILVVTFGEGVHGFSLDQDIGEFVLTHPNLQIPKRGNIYSLNEANKYSWDEPVQEYVKNMKKGDNQTGEKYKSRYIGSMVGDVHRTLLYGGIFGYPADEKNPTGKLRLLYEAAPMSFIVEQAGGKSTTGYEGIMELTPESVHQRVPIFLGSDEDIDELLSYYELRVQE